MWVFWQCLVLAAGDSCALLWWCCWLSRFYRFGSAVSIHAKPGQFGYILEMERQRSQRKAAEAVWIRKTRRSCSASTSMEELLVSTELPMDSRRVNEEYPVAQILSTTSRIFLFHFFLLILWWISSKIPSFFSSFLCWYLDGFAVVYGGKPGVFWYFNFFLFNGRSKKMDDCDMYRSGEFKFYSD